MNVGELRAELAEYPDDMPVAIIDDLHDCLDSDTVVDIAIDYSAAGFSPNGRQSWKWRRDASAEHADLGTETVVIF